MGTVVSCMRTFHFDKNADTIDAYVQRIRQVAAMLSYGE